MKNNKIDPVINQREEEKFLVTMEENCFAIEKKIDRKLSSEQF